MKCKKAGSVSTSIGVLILGLLASVGVSISALAQNATSQSPGNPASLTGAINFDVDGGFSFGMPANQAFVMAPDGSSASSQPRNLLDNTSFTVGVNAWKNLGPFFDLGWYDNGKATASVESYSATVSGSALSFTGGLRVNVPVKNSRDHWYLQFGGGTIRQNANSSAGNFSSTTGTVMYGGGIRAFWGRHGWGSDAGIDGFRTNDTLTNGHQNFVRVRIGIFYSTKASVSKD
jgi:hypothetical protein